MGCERVRDEIVTLLGAAEEVHWPQAVSRHLAGCEGCRAEWEALSQTWSLLGQWQEASPPAEVRARLLRRVRRELIKESVLTVGGWVPAVLAATIGVALSLGLSILVPYSFLVSLCRQALQVADPHAAPYLLAGMAYGLPLAAGAWIVRRRAVTGAVIGSLEASLLFLVILAPYVIAQCREFGPVLQVAFISGLGMGAVGSSVAAVGLARLVQSGSIPA